MRGMHTLNSRFIAFILLLVFSQKGGARLWLHACLHARASSPYSSYAIHWERSQLKCGCLDDLMMPMTPVQHFELSPPGRDYIVYVNPCTYPIFSLTRHYPSLRGPPVPDLDKR
jgi:hypothetical protein